jgi:uncharacterized small protein (TIGR04563 family)
LRETQRLSLSSIRVIGSFAMSTAMRESTKQSLYFPMEMLAEIRQEAKRLDRSLSWVIQRAWAVARGEIRQMPDSDGR